MAPMSTWNSFSDGIIPLYLKVGNFPFMEVNSLQFYNPATLITTPLSPLIIPCVKRLSDATSSVSITGNNLKMTMEPMLKLTRTSSGVTKTYEFDGGMQFFSAELMSDVGFYTIEKSPPLLSRSLRIQSLFTASELSFAGVSPDYPTTSLYIKWK